MSTANIDSMRNKVRVWGRAQYLRVSDHTYSARVSRLGHILPSLWADSR